MRANYFFYFNFRESSLNTEEAAPKVDAVTPNTPVQNTQNSGRDVKTKGPVIRESIKMVANQLLDKPSNVSADAPIVTDTRVPPRIKNQVHKHSIKTRNDDGDEPIENGHAGVAVPVTMEDLEKENNISESSTTNEGISTWILLSNPANKDNFTGSTEPTKIEDSTKKQKPAINKNKTKRPQNNKSPVAKRPIIGSTNKSDLVAGGSAINENVYNKIKDTVLSNVQKNKITSTQRTTTPTTTTLVTTTEILTTKKEVSKAPSTISPIVKITSKPTKKKNKNKQKVTTTPVAPIVNESALLPTEAKEQEIELEVSTPAASTKKPKRSSTRKKNKTKKRKTTTSKTEEETSVTEVKTNKTKSAKPAKKPGTQSGPITTQIYNYLSREVMPVGVGVLGLASLVGLASYFLYPFATPVRRTFEVDKKDDIYRNNAEEYASEGNGQAEEEMLGTVLAGMPAHAKHKLNPYAGQTVTHGNRYTVKKEQDLRYRHVAANREPNYNVHYPQQKTGIAHGAVYSKPVNYSPHQYETRNVYTTESKYTYDVGSNAYTPYPAVEPIYAAPQTGPSGVSSYGSDNSNSVVYGVKPTSDTDFRPVYPFEGQIYSETTINPVTYPPTSMYLGSNNDSEEPENKYEENETQNTNSGPVDNKFVVGNVPKELVDSATPAVVPEHGPRKLRRKRHTVLEKRSVNGNLEEILNEANKKDVFISNEIDDSFGYVKYIVPGNERTSNKNEATTQPETKDVITVFAVSTDPKNENITSTDLPSTIRNEVIESISTVPINKAEKSTTESDSSNELDVTTKAFRVYEVFSNPTEGTEQNSPIIKDESPKTDTTTFRNMMTETTTELKSETTSTMPPTPSPVSDPVPTKSTEKNKDTDPEIITYPPPSHENGFFSLLRRFLEFKYRLGMSILQTTSDNLKRYLEDTMQKAVKASV